MIKLVASDLDGTLLLNGAQSLPEELFPLIKELKELGILFVAASGRQYIRNEPGAWNRIQMRWILWATPLLRSKTGKIKEK